MTKIEVVGHCFAKHHPHYAAALCHQLSSLILHPIRSAHVTATVCLDPTDLTSYWMFDFFRNRHDINMKLIPLDLPHLGRRAIGRNIAALQTDADIVWFTDIDVCFGGGCLDALANFYWPDDVSIIYPPDTWISRDHATGDQTLARVNGTPQLIGIDSSEFIPKRYNSPIGPVQIVQGDFARKHGYLKDNEKLQKPVTDGKFARCIGDPAYRRFCKQHGKVGTVDLPSVYRIRHSEASSSAHKVLT